MVEHRLPDSQKQREVVNQWALSPPLSAVLHNKANITILQSGTAVASHTTASRILCLSGKNGHDSHIIL